MEKIINEMFEKLFSEEVFVDVAIFSKSMNGFVPSQTSENVSMKIEEGTLAIKNKDGDSFFRMIGIRINPHHELKFLPFNSEFRKRIKHSPNPESFIISEPIFNSKSKEKQFKKLLNSFLQEKSFFNARRLFFFISKNSENSLFLSSEFGFSGIRIKVLNIKNPGFGSKLSNKEISIAELSRLKKKKSEIEEELRKSKDTIKKLEEKMNKYKQFIN